MKIFATYNIKGGVGKTAAAVNLSYLASVVGYRTLLWDLDPQGAATYYFRIKPKFKGGSTRLIAKKSTLPQAIKATDYTRLDVMPSDISLRHLDVLLSETKSGRARFEKLINTIRPDYDLLFLDCAPSLSLASENVLALADWLLIPIIPTHLSIRAYAQLRAFCRNDDVEIDHLLPFFSMVDKRKRLHRDLVVNFAADHDEVLRTYIPYSSQIERMGEHRAPVNTFAASATGGRAFTALWDALAGRVGLQTLEDNA